MAEDELPIVITAIADAQSEGFVASGLFAQGWSVVYRALDTTSLRKYLVSNPDIAKSALLLYTPELPELNPASCFELSGMVKQSIGFSNDLEKYKEYPGLYEIPKDLTELVSLVRGSIRSPLIRQHLPIQHKARRAQVIAIGSAGSGVGCTTVAINIAMELSVLEKSTLLIDANFRAPSIAVLLSLRNLLSDEGWRSVAPQLSISEITQLLGNPLKALALAGSPEVKKLGKAEEIEMRIVASGARRDLGESDAAVITLTCKELKNESEEWSVRLRYAYADALAHAGRKEEAREWFIKCAEIDREEITDASERVDE